MAENTPPSHFSAPLPHRPNSPSKKRAISGGLLDTTNQPPTAVFERTVKCCPSGSMCDTVDVNMDQTISQNSIVLQVLGEVKAMREELKAIREDTKATKEMQQGFSNELGDMKKTGLAIEKSVEKLHKKVDHISGRVDYIFEQAKKRDGKFD